MLDSGTLRAICGVRERSKVNFSQPFSLPASSPLLIAAALGAIAGLYFFFHGFSLLQDRHYEHARGLLQKTTHGVTVAAPAAITVHNGDTLKRESPEVIHLSSSEEIQIDSASMTQQGKIAAALLRAGIRNPVTASTNRLQTSVADAPASESTAQTQESNTDVARVLQKSANALEIPLPSLSSATPRPSTPWKASAMIWGGPALTLACIYILAAHLGWL
jgi:hypothetical protein